MAYPMRPWAVRAAVLLTAMCWLTCGLRAADPNVPRFLAGRQTSPDNRVHPPERWSATENVAWKTDIAYGEKRLDRIFLLAARDKAERFQSWAYNNFKGVLRG